MNILFFADYVFEDSPGGSRVVARELARGLAARGHAVTFLVRAKEGRPASDTAENGVRVVRYAVPPGGARAYVRAGRDACARLLQFETFDIAVRRRRHGPIVAAIDLLAGLRRVEASAHSYAAWRARAAEECQRG